MPYASPLYGDPTGLPPTLIQVGSDEILLDDSVRMAERMRAAGCQVELEVWPRMPHTWHVWARVMPEARAAIERIGAFVQSKMSVGLDENPTVASTAQRVGSRELDPTYELLLAARVLSCRRPQRSIAASATGTSNDAGVARASRTAP